MDKDTKIIKFRPEWFAAYGLNKEKNYLQAPICECGCGSKAVLLLSDREELFGFMFNMLLENECNHCGMFAHAFDGSMYVAIKVCEDEEDPVKFFGIEETDMTFFKGWDDELELHSYGLLIESKHGEWKIIED